MLQLNLFNLGLDLIQILLCFINLIVNYLVMNLSRVSLFLDDIKSSPMFYVYNWLLFKLSVVFTPVIFLFNISNIFLFISFIPISELCLVFFRKSGNWIYYWILFRILIFALVVFLFWLLFFMNESIAITAIISPTIL